MEEIIDRLSKFGNISLWRNKLDNSWMCTLEMFSQQESVNLSVKFFNGKTARHALEGCEVELHKLLTAINNKMETLSNESK